MPTASFTTSNVYSLVPPRDLLIAKIDVHDCVSAESEAKRCRVTTGMAAE